LNNKIIDIIIFGSLVKSGSARDIDLAILVEGKTDLIALKKKIRSLVGENADIQVINIQSIYSPLWLTLIKEGYSINKERFFFELYSIQPMILYKYSLSTLNNIQKVQFERGIKMILKKEGRFVARAVALVPIHLKNRMMEFLKQWGIYYESQEYELLPLLRKEEI
jgi:predicted nucleotidyltransferase